MPLLKTLFRKLAADEAGGTAIEYGLIAALIVVALLGGLTAVTDANNANYDLIEEKLVV
ncbi:pilin [Hyphomonas sp. CACIAM 19H1]|uniref:Flp family type IVb pilin n=1 Tax=Hyphomonas sp. CACIAM 19H1 TaxID=1873716 RepID=UPI000DF0B810|nr:Flp family type IVb pilin [Hyphomonas sp. CACIAM 19H1]AXE65577.1 pilin [Hyphomonas sp. CACIAM 19H1]